MPGIPLVAIVGRPNVGKSTLFNRMIGAKRAIVQDMPGVTRDRHYGEVEWYGRRFNLVDTGGFVPSTADLLLSLMREQAELAIEEADLILIVFDVRDGLTTADWEIVEMMRRTDKPVYYVINKVDGPKQEASTWSFHELGVSPFFPVSAEHGLGIDELLDQFTEGFPEVDIEEGPEEAVRLAVLGRPNVGKSTFINRLLGEDRLLTSDVPGTTRDAIDSRLVYEGTEYLLIDTAGVRRRRSISELVEKFSVVKSFKSIDRAEVVLFLIDAERGPADQDARLIRMVQEKGKAIYLVVNKWDLVEKDERTAGQYALELRERWPYFDHAPIEFISALTGQRVTRVLRRTLKIREAWNRRLPTSELNRFLKECVTKRHPPVYRNRKLKLYYASQVCASPPTFMLVCNYPDAVPMHYKKYLINQLRGVYDFEGTPVKLFFRARTKKDEDLDAP